MPATEVKPLSKTQKILLGKMLSRPEGPWWRGSDMRVAQGVTRTLWSLEKRGLVEFVRSKDGCGWQLTVTGKQKAQALQ